MQRSEIECSSAMCSRKTHSHALALARHMQHNISNAAQCSAVKIQCSSAMCSCETHSHAFARALTMLRTYGSGPPVQVQRGAVQRGAAQSSAVRCSAAQRSAASWSGPPEPHPLPPPQDGTCGLPLMACGRRSAPSKTYRPRSGN
jgi:hypothetical protein